MECSPKIRFKKYAAVICDLAIEKMLDYGITDEQLDLAKPGMRVKIPIKGKLQTGYIFAVKESSEYANARAIHSILSETELISNELLELAKWIGEYYCTPLRQVFKSILPSSIRQNHSHKEQFYVERAQSKEILRAECAILQRSQPAQAKILEALLNVKKGILLTELLEKTAVSKSPIATLEKKGFLTIGKVQIDRSPLSDEEYFKTVSKKLNPEQEIALQKINASLSTKNFETHLLFGVTGSGKTEIYLQAIEKALELGLGTIMLVPEISLTGQTIERFRSRFDEKIAILHHRLSHGERFDEWHRMRCGEAKIAIGARSALFSPIQNLGLIIVDEEHDGAYKQSEERPCYQARDVAVMRGKLSQSTVVLGSATPSIESYHNAISGKYHLSKLTLRAASAQLPIVTIVDMKKEFEKFKGYTSFSEILIDKMKKRIELGEQTILFLNRRGYHTSMQCSGCGHIFNCPRCDLPYTFHRGENTLACHLCDARLSPPPRNCPQCGNHQTLKYRGIGTEQIERALHALFPGVRTLRIDGDTTRHKGSHERLFREFRTGKADILIGTQMVAKGLHFPSVTLVSILNSDGALHIPDFRASENIFQLITQVSGRAGRGELPGEVIIQTQMPDNPTIQLASKQNFEHFFQTEIEARKMFGFPPFTHIVKITFSGLEAQATEEIAQKFRYLLESKLDAKYYQIHPLIPSGYAKIKDHFRFQFLIRGKNASPINREIKNILAHFSIPKEIRVHIDVDPHSTFF